MLVRSAVSLLTLLFLLVVPILPVAAASEVRPGQSIQAAINAAPPGSTVRVAAGTFQESLIISKPLRLVGAGARGGGTVLVPPATAPASPCNTPTTTVGICVPGDPAARIANVEITELLIRGFTGDGVLALGTSGFHVHDMQASSNGGYGVANFDGLGTRFHDTVTRDNGDAGIYLGDSLNTGARINDNIATGNEIGLFIRDSTRVEVNDNQVTGNCLGILLLDTGAPNAAGEFNVHDNNVSNNNKVCPGDGAPPLNGAGIVLAGVHDVVVHDNRVNDNRSTPPSFASGGISLLSTAMFGGGVPTRNTVRDNTALRNAPFDLSDDESGSDNRFRDNRCQTSQPPGLCGPGT